MKKDKDLEFIESQIRESEELLKIKTEEDYSEQLEIHRRLLAEKRAIAKSKSDNHHEWLHDGIDLGDALLKHGTAIGLGIASIALSMWMFKEGLRFEDEGHTFRFQTFRNFLSSSIKKR